MNKHLKPGVAVDVRGASDEDVQAVIEACARLGLNMAKLGSGKGFIVLAVSGGEFWECYWECGLPAISINQALGRESEVEKNEFCGTDMQPIGWHGEITYGSRAVFNKCVILPDGKIAINLQNEWNVKDFDHWIGKGFYFRPLKTEKEKFVERLFNETGNITENEARALYDKGLRFTE